MVLQALVTSKGQLTLPVELRNRWHIQPGDRVEFFTDRDGHVHLRPLNAPPSAFFEALPPRRRLPGIASDDAAIAAAVGERDRRARRTEDAAE
jgi:AbrB family looped-hinge helix DNA binding protein